MSNDTQELVVEYILDEHDRILSFNDGFRVFAQENDACSLLPKVVGSELWNHIAGLEIREMYRLLLDQVRLKGRSIRIPYRCDAPWMLRDLELELEPLPGGLVRIRSRTRRLELRQALALLDPRTERDPTRLLIVCSWCKRIQDGSAWVEPDAYLQTHRLLTAQVLPQISHGMCRDCRTRVFAALDLDATGV